MAFLGSVYQWQIFWADLEPGVGSEQKGESRPVLIVSNDGFNGRFSVVTIVPLTKELDKKREIYPFEVRLPAGIAGSTIDGIIMPYQIRTIAKIRLLSLMGTLTDFSIRAEVEERIMEHIGIELELSD